MTYKMDLIDRKIICQLDQNCRIPISQLAKYLRISRSVANYRINNLEKEGIITNYICSVNLGLLGYKTYKLSFKIQTNKETEEKTFIKYLKENPQVIHFLKNEGSYDYSITIAVKSIHDLDNFIMDLKNEFPNTIKSENIEIVIYSKIYKLDKFLLDEKDKIEKITKIEPYSGEDKKIKIDDNDKKILRELSQNANLSIMDLNKKTNLSVDIIKYRLKNLSKTVINSNRVIIDFNKIGLYHYVLTIKTKQLTKQSESALLSFCANEKNVLYITKRLGYYDFAINFAIGSINELNSFISKFKEKFRTLVDEYELVLNSELIKLNYVPF